MSHPVWDELLGQPEAIEQVQLAVAGKANALHHAWLFSGPAGSGRSNMAQAFAAALQCQDDGCGSCQQCRLIAAGAHPDVTTATTDRVLISIDEVRALVAQSQLSTTLGRFRIMIIEDADRMAERSSNVLLKALEEPPTDTIWILCAPSVADMLPTIRSRVRNLNLRLPSVEEVADLLVRRDGVDPKLARLCAAEAQCHVGMARRLAVSSEARARRAETLRIALGVTNLSQAMVAAEKLLGVAKRDAEAASAEKDGTELENLRTALGIAEGDKPPPQLRSQFKQLEENQKRRSTRSLRDGIDRILTDLESVFRDLASIQLATGADLINAALGPNLEERAASTTIDQTLLMLDEISLARKRLGGNVRDLLLLEALSSRLIHRPSYAA